MLRDVIVVTTPYVPGYEVVRVLGLVYGLTVRARGFGGKLIAAVEGVFGGEITAYTEECIKAREEALNRMKENARRLGANAVISADFETSDIIGGTATLFSVYGTAVIVRPTTG
ncbi:MAG TPA: YbjQ family protein [Candidatus Bathyarchaeota archaeon]|nr:YbjQ family protein [Candidatus Bathyarchaeota archaeon]